MIHMSDQYLLKTLSNAIDVLSLFEEKVELTPNEIKDRVSMNRTNLFRILYTLRHKGLLECDTESGKYRVGIKTVHLASLFLQRLDIKNISHSHLVKLRDCLDETVHLVVMNNNLSTFVDKIEAGEDIYMGSYIGWSAPLYCTASGKLLLSFESDGHIKNYLETVKRKKYTPNTVDTAVKFLENIEEIRRLGYSLDEEEMVEGLTCIACSIKDHEERPIASISVSGPTTRMKMKKEVIIENLFKTADNISDVIKKTPFLTKWI
jgi:IclR family KDG regulon transcriptional repressor